MDREQENKLVEQTLKTLTTLRTYLIIQNTLIISLIAFVLFAMITGAILQ